MIAAIKSPSSLYVAAAVTIAAGAAAMYIEQRKRKEEEGDNAEEETTKPKEEKKEEVVAPEPVAPEPVASEPAAPTGNKKVVVLMTSYCANPNIKASQDRAMTILKGLKIGDDQLETIDGAQKDMREKRNELFGLSGIRAKYPQFFVVDQSDATSFVANWEDFEAMNEMGTLKQALNLA